MKSHPDVERIDLETMRVHFDDGEIGLITNWIDVNGDVFDQSIAEPVSLVVKHPTLTVKPWYALAVYPSEWCVIR
ncbi:hypothetical protein [Methylobacterium sp. WL120]|uniref:hypothetical protein n=1 Tax=Methylobacterium sp. WL120 TaxID=2603887 RepID=UPI0011CAE839|nr:hypothetical protein [Methylobacterium sp. WL120]TXM68177.1 hypothetical protein FV229_08355 [Methylobacterium sp. WL120]